MIQILELVHFGIISQNGFAEVLVDLHIDSSDITLKNIRAFIDTGAVTTSIKESFISDKIDFKDLEKVQKGSAGSSFESVQIPGIGIRLPMIPENKFIPLTIGTVNINMEYDIIIGNDILNMCEFIYNGISKTYLLKLYQSATSINIKIL